MRNRKGFYTKSVACVEAEESGKNKVSFRCPEAEAWGCGVEWHHGGSGIIAFFPKDDAEMDKVLNLREQLVKRQIKSKKDAIEYLEHSTGSYKIPYKVGKYGKFFNFLGEPDGELSIEPTDINFNDICSLLGV